MATAPQTGMEKGEMKALLNKSKSDPVNCAVGIAPDGNMAVLLMNKIKQPKALEKELQKAIPDAKSLRWGTVSIDADTDPKLVRFMLNKPVSGLARRLAKTLKGTGYSKVELLTEDGEAIESAAEKEDGEGQGDAPVVMAQEVSDQVAGAAPVRDVAAEIGALKKELTTLLGRVAALPDATRSEMVKIAGAANAALKANDAAAAQEAIGRLHDALEGPQSAPSDVPAAAAGAVAYAKSRLVWQGTRKKVASQVDALVESLAKQYEAEGLGDIVRKRVRLRLTDALETFDDTLADTLDDAANEADPAKRQKLVQEAQAIVAKYQKYLAAEPLIAKLDANPFAPTAIGKTMAATLTALSASIR